MIRAICFYLPQYHPIKENDEWWGAGFTEWRNVTKALPNFEGHYQPRVPSDLGYYDLRLVDVQARQAELAKSHGIHGFCYYYYWFAGRRLLEGPLEQLLKHDEIDLPFCVCWANENWTRAWDGRANDVLIAQNHTPDDDIAFIRSLLPAFADRRYIRVDGKPLLAMYRVDLLPNPKQTAERWRKVLREEGFPGLYLAAVQFHTTADPRTWGFDASIEFPPHQYVGKENAPDALPRFTNPAFAGGVTDYQKVVAQALKRALPDYTLLRGVMPCWDNTARRLDTPHIFVNSSPLDYQFWLRNIAEQTRQVRRGDEQIVFINAWNEWGEGAYLEPDARYGRAYLEATRGALEGATPLDELLAGINILAQGHHSMIEQIRAAFEARERSLFALQEVIRRKNSLIAELTLRADAAQQSPSTSNGANGHQALHDPLLERASRELARFPRLQGALKTLWPRRKRTTS